jgi:hypothetical protein
MPFERTNQLKYTSRAGRYPHMRVKKSGRPAYVVVEEQRKASGTLTATEGPTS